MKNPTVYGLIQKSDINVIYNVESKAITNVNGCSLVDDIIEVSDEISFSIPLCVFVNNIPLFPSKYEFINDGEIIYSKLFPPRMDIKINDDNPLSERAKTKENTITLQDLRLYDINNRKRSPSQKQIMKESAKEHVQKLINNGILSVPDNLNIQWHWCHLVSFRMLPTNKAQKKNNLFCGTSACNGHMINIESAVKNFIYEYKRPLGLEITVTLYQNTQVARRIRYRVYDKKGSKNIHSEYFDALTTIKTDVLDSQTIYNRMTKKFNNQID